MSTSHALSPARLAANRANAQCSTGPRTEAGKAQSSQNALKTGLTGRTVLLPSEDAQAYEEHILHFVEAFHPVGERETRLVQSLADTQWRLDRIPSLEAGMFALGRINHAHLFERIPDTPLRHQLLDAHIAQADAKHFKNLHMQESRLRRYYRQDLQELTTVQAERKEAEAQQTKAKTHSAAAVNGFEFAAPQSSLQKSASELPEISKTPDTPVTGVAKARNSAA